MLRLKLNRLKIDRAAVIDELKQAGVTTSVHWLPLHMHPYYRDKYGYAPNDLPMAASLYPEIVTLPLFPDMTEEQVGYVSHTLKSVLARHLKSGPRRAQPRPLPEPSPVRVFAHA